MGTYDPAVWGLTEETVTIAIASVAFLVYEVGAWSQKNPLYGSVFIWVIVAIWIKANSTYPQYTNLTDSAIALGIIHGISMVALWTWYGTTQFYDVTSVTTKSGLFLWMVIVT